MDSVLQAMETALRSSLAHLEQTRDGIIRTENELRMSEPVAFLSLTGSTTLLSCDIKYHRPIKFCKVEEEANPKLIRTVHEFPEDDFNTEVNGDTTIRTLKPGRNPTSTYDVSFNRPLHKKLFTASTYAAVSVAGGLGIVVAPEASPVIYAGAAAASAAIGAASVNSVRVTFFARRSDIEYLYMEHLSERKRNIETQIPVLRQQLDTVLTQRNADLVEKLEHTLHICQDELTQVGEMLEFNEAVSHRWNQPLRGTFHTGAEEVEAYRHVADILFPPQSSDIPASIRLFCTTYDHVLELLHPTQQAPDAAAQPSLQNVLANYRLQCQA